jgi:AcrR family transcriptional regulator
VAVVTSADLLLHPVRLRIVQAFLGDRALTTGGLAAELSDVPPATLYRHVARLVEAGALQVVAERRIRGAVERTYVLRTSAALITPDQVASMSVEDMRQAFMAFVAGLLDDVDRYLARADVDPVRDGATFRLSGLWLDDVEFVALLRELGRVLLPAAANPPRPGRTRRILATVVLSGEEAGDDKGVPPAPTAGRGSRVPRGRTRKSGDGSRSSPKG